MLRKTVYQAQVIGQKPDSTSRNVLSDSLDSELRLADFLILFFGLKCLLNSQGTTMLHDNI